ncbi:hypothetical protein [Streptomyces sp. URMC 125]|uniref:hypothetical protein n=1 Tax=Streptomyces sp. URMC 125 TaxID=3423419 RepID=UPI003F19D37D
MGEITPAAESEGAANGYTALAAKLQAMQQAADALLEQAEQVASRMRRNANAAVTLADLCAAAEVDPRHVAVIGDVSLAFGRVAGGGRQVAAASEAVSEAAGHLRAQHRVEYGGIHAAAAASRARQAKPGFYRQT